MVELDDLAQRSRQGRRMVRAFDLSMTAPTPRPTITTRSPALAALARRVFGRKAKIVKLPPFRV